MLVKFHYQANPLQSFGVPADMVMTVEPRDAGGTEIVLKNALCFIAMESVDEILSSVNDALAGKAGSSATAKRAVADGAPTKVGAE